MSSNLDKPEIWLGAFKLEARRAAGRAARYTTSPGFGWCYRCLMPWNLVESHVTHYGVGHGCFPLCDWCWPQLTPEERLPYYEELVAGWRMDSALDNGAPWPETLTLIRNAVLAGG